MLTDIYGQPIHLDDSGAGAPVLLLHAAASSGMQWMKTKKVLNPRYRVLIPDLAGEGRTPGPSDWSDLLGTECDGISALIKSIGGPVHVVGHSYGAVIAMRLAAEHPHLFSSLVLIEPVAFNLLRAYPFNEDHKQLLDVKNACTSALAEGNRFEAARFFISYWSGESSWQNLSPSLQKTLAGVMPKVVYGWDAIAADPRDMDFYRQIRIPALMISGDSGPKPIQWVAHQLALNITASAFCRIWGAGHMSPITHPEAVTDAIQSHIQAAEARNKIFTNLKADDWQTKKTVSAK